MNDWEILDTVPAIPKNITPISYTGFHYLVECPLRFSFSRDNRYPVKINPKARMGSAFHVALAFLTENENISLHDIIGFFEDELKRQRTEAMLNYRERSLPWPRDLREAMENALAVKFESVSQGKSIRAKRHTDITLLSPDGNLIGRPDAILLTADGLIIVDYKTGRLDYDSIVTYEDQICFYSGIWEETYGVTPKYGRIEFLLDGYTHNFAINKERCESILSSARSLSLSADRVDQMLTAIHGEHCRFCDYRPWCRTYWDRNEIEGNIEGLICSVHPRDSQSFCLCASESHVCIVNRNPVPLPEWENGTFIRALDLMGVGNVKYKSQFSEIFRFMKKASIPT